MLKADLTQRQKRKIWEKVDKQSGGEHGCWTWLGTLNKEGYGQARLSVKGMAKTFYAHRLIYELHHDKDIHGAIIRHTCANPKCVNPRHLRSGTHDTNVKDRVLSGRTAIGENNGRAVLTEEQVAIIKKMFILGLNAYEISKVCQVTEKALANIRDAKTWRHVASKTATF